MDGSREDITSVSSLTVSSDLNSSLNTSTCSSSVFNFKALFGGRLSGRQSAELKLNPVYFDNAEFRHEELKLPAEEEATVFNVVQGPTPNHLELRPVDLNSPEVQDSGLSNTPSDLSSDVSAEFLKSHAGQKAASDGTLQRSQNAKNNKAVTNVKTKSDARAEGHETAVAQVDKPNNETHNSLREHATEVPHTGGNRGQTIIQRTPTVRKVEQNESGEIELTINKRPSSVHIKLYSSSDGQHSQQTNYHFEKQFSPETRIVVNENAISFVSTSANNSRENTLTRKVVHDKAPVDDESDHYQSIDSVEANKSNQKFIQSLPTLSNTNDVNAEENFDDLDYLYTQVRKGHNLSSVESHYNTVNTEDPKDVTSLSSCGSEKDFDYRSDFQKPMYSTPNVHLKNPSVRSQSLRSDIDALYPSTVDRTLSEGANNKVISASWDPLRSGKKRKKNRLNPKNATPYINPVTSSPDKQLKPILVSAGSSSRLNESTEKSTLNRSRGLSSHSSLTDQKSVTFSEDTKDNENKSKRYRDETVNLCDLHKAHYTNGLNNNRVVFLKNEPFDGSYSWPAQPVDNYVGIVNEGFAPDSERPTDIPKTVCRKCCQLGENFGNAAQLTQTVVDDVTYVRPLHDSSKPTELPRRDSESGLKHDVCTHDPALRHQCMACVQEDQQLRLHRRRTTMRWALLVFLIIVVLGLAVGLAVYFGTKQT